MFMVKSYKTNKIRNKKWALLLVLIIIAGLLIVFLKSDLLGNKTSKSVKQGGYRSSSNKAHDQLSQSIPGGSSAQGGAIDKNGSSAASTSSNTKPTVSESGAISLVNPSPNSSLGSGSSISGNATVEKVNFRLIDNDTGVVAQGQLNVVNGSFSGILNFRHQSSSGRLDVFNYSSDGAEINEIQLPVALK
jgi:hypothetical protein